MPPAPSPQDYVELRARSAFSFLEGSAQPEDLAERAAELGHDTLALADRHGVSGAPRFHKRCSELGSRIFSRNDVTFTRECLPCCFERRKPSRCWRYLWLLKNAREGRRLSVWLGEL